MSESDAFDLRLMQMHVRALYVHDENQRITSINDWRGGDAPRFFLGRTDQGNVWRFGCDLPAEVCSELESLCREEPLTRFDRPKHESAYVRILSRQYPIERTWLGPAYWFPTPGDAPGGTLSMTEENADLLRGGLDDWIPDVPHQQPFAAMIVAGRAVAVCASVRITDVAHEAGVETLKSHRRKGYALSAVSSWANAVEKRGAVPLYSTSHDNLASQRLAARLRMPRYGVDFHIA